MRKELDLKMSKDLNAGASIETILLEVLALISLGGQGDQLDLLPIVLKVIGLGFSITSDIHVV